MSKTTLKLNGDVTDAVFGGCC